MGTPKFIIDEDGFSEISDQCLNCEYSYIEDIWWDWQCDKKECPYDVKENE